MECNLENRQNLIALYLSGELTGAEAEKFEEHYFQCEVCFKELRAMEDAVNLIENEGKSVLNLKESNIPESSNFIKKIFGTSNQMKINWGVTVAFTIIILAILFITLPTNDEQDLKNRNVVIKQDSTNNIQRERTGQEQLPQKNHDEDLAANLTGPDFTPDPYMEEWSNENVRSINDKLDKVISPAAGEKIYNKDISFRWSMIQNETVSFKIMTNKEKEVFSKSVEKGFPKFTITVAPGIFKHSGLYYWKIEDEDEVLHIGKFYFIKQEN